MAMDTASPSRNLWQIPTFIVGILALVAVWHGRSYWQPSPAQRYERDLQALRQLLEKVPTDVAQVQNLLRKVHGMQPPPQLERQSPYIIGSALVVVAEANGVPEEAAEQWKAARKLLETAEEYGVDAGDKLRHRHRLAKTWARTGESTGKVIDALAATLACGDDPSEANRLLAELHLKLDPPDIRMARDYLKDYLAHVLPGRSESQYRQLNFARLQLGEIHTQLAEPEEARKVLERIGPDSPSELLISARMLLAKNYLAEEDYSQAIRCLEQARDVRGITAAQRANVQYLLADSYHKANRRTEAQAVLEVIRKGSGPEAQAASFRIAEWQLNDPAKSEVGLKTLETSLNSIADGYDSPLYPLADVRSLCEDAAVKFRTAHAFDLSLRVSKAYARVALDGRDRELAAEALQAWGQALLDRAPMVDTEDRPRFVDDGTKRLRESAKQWHAVAGLKKTSIEKGEPLYKAADLYLKAGDQEDALKVLDELGLKVPDFPQARMAEYWLKKGEVYLALGNRDQARICFQNGVQAAEQNPSPSPTLIRNRIRLAEVLLKSSDPKTLAKAVADLEKVLSDPEFSRDKDLHESALFFVADANYQQKEFLKAEVRFRSLLDTYPESTRAPLARFQLGQCYWFIAGQEADKCKTAKKIIEDAAAPEERRREAEIQYESSYKQYMEWLKKAIEPFRMVETMLLRGMTNPKLSLADAELLRKASLAAADCSFFSGDYDDCVQRYDTLSQRYAGTVVQLEALRSMWRCYQYYLQKPEKALDSLTQMRTVFLQLPDTEFDGSSDVRKREYWQKWFDQIAPMKK
ncbi:MAG: tetratricopeptide repeat protein [Planctomycetes bacterium]|nr:tetratricopeptide repeat protein [Planctomycetota bacterium]